MNDKITISTLFSKAAKFMRSEFEFIRNSNPHSGEKGEEIENVLINFLNVHMPKRFQATSGFIIDEQNGISKQTDIIIYDSFSSPVYRSSTKSQIVPVNSVASVIEVKTSLNKAALEDAVEKIASCRRLKKRELDESDQSSTGSALRNISTQGIIFGFDSDTSLETLSDNLVSILGNYSSDLWPEMVVVLDKGVIGFSVQFPGAKSFSGGFSIPAGDRFPLAPMYICLGVYKDGEFTFNRFFTRVLAQLNFYPRRSNLPNFDVAMEGASTDVLNIAGYQYNLSRQLAPVREEDYGFQSKVKWQIDLFSKSKASESHRIGIIQHLNWQDGAVIRKFGGFDLFQVLLKLVQKQEFSIINDDKNGCQLSSVLSVSLDDFKKWPLLIDKHTKYKAKLVEIA